METFIHLIQLIFSLRDVTAGYIISTKGSIEIEKEEEISLESKMCISTYEDMISFKSKVHQVTVSDCHFLAISHFACWDWFFF